MVDNWLNREHNDYKYCSFGSYIVSTVYPKLLDASSCRLHGDKYIIFEVLTPKLLFTYIKLDFSLLRFQWILKLLMW